MMETMKKKKKFHFYNYLLNVNGEVRMVNGFESQDVAEELSRIKLVMQDID